MKKPFIFFFLSLICITLNAQFVEKVYNFEEPEIVDVDGYSIIKFRNCRQYADVGCPSLPYQSSRLLLPMGCETESVEIQYLDFKEIEGEYILYPFQQAVPYSRPDMFKFEKNDIIYNSKSVYPSKSHNDVTTHYLNGFSFAFVNFTPVQYIPSEGKIMYAQKVKVSVKTTPEKINHSSMLWNTPLIRQSVSRLAQNLEMISSYRTRERSLAGYDILVVTGQDYIDGFEEYVNHYENIGYRTRVAVVEDIYYEMTGIDEQDKIRNYVKQEYQDSGISMLILGGDVDIVPYRGLYCAVGSMVDEGIPADLYYAALDGTWNNNCNDLWGEPDEADLLPEIGVARLSFENAEEQENMIHKSLSYQREPIMGEFRDVVFGSELMDSTPTYGGDFLELLIGKRHDNGYTTNGIPEEYNVTRIYEEHGNWSGANLRNAINQGTQYIHHCGHAYPEFVAGWYLDDITNYNFSEVDGVRHNFTFLHTHGCTCAAFDEDCVMERMVDIENFCVAVSGNSRYGWYHMESTDGPSPHLHRELVDAQYNEKINNLAMSLRETQIQCAPWVVDEDAFRWNFYDLNVLGDGAAPIWLDEPFMTNVDCESYIKVGSEKIELTVTNHNGETMEGFRCSYYSENDELLALAMTDENGKAELIFESPLTEDGTAKIIVTGPNAFPNIKEIKLYHYDNPYIVMENYLISDNDGQVDYSENHTFDISLKNIGNKDSNSINAILTCDKPHYVNITTAEFNVGNLDANAEITIEDAFAFTVCDSVPDNTNVIFSVVCSDGNDNWETKFDIDIYAPDFEIVKPDGMELKPGDAVTIEFVIINKGGSTSNNIVFSIFHPEEIILSQDKFEITGLASGEETIIELTLTVAENAEYGLAYEMPLAVYSGRYITYDSYAVSMGTVTEDFESGDFLKHNWEFEDDYVWEIVTDCVFDGLFSAKSNNIEDLTSTALKITVDVKSESMVSFYKKVSSEADYDFFKFYIDYQELGEWSGEIDWSMESFPIEEGLHTLKWVYRKDESSGDGQDCAWLDNITLPPTSIIVDVETMEETDVEIYPNPARDFIKLSAVSCQLSVVKIYNTFGILLEEIEMDSDEMTINVSDYKSGIYFINIQTETGSLVTKFVKD